MNPYVITGHWLNAYARAGHLWVRWVDDWALWHLRMGTNSRR